MFTSAFYLFRDVIINVQILFNANWFPRYNKYFKITSL